MRVSLCDCAHLCVLYVYMHIQPCVFMYVCTYACIFVCAVRTCVTLCMSVFADAELGEEGFNDSAH